MVHMFIHVYLYIHSYMFIYVFKMFYMILYLISINIFMCVYSNTFFLFLYILGKLIHLLMTSM